jgi:hypothetical protein
MTDRIDQILGDPIKRHIIATECRKAAGSLDVFRGEMEGRRRWHAMTINILERVFGSIQKLNSDPQRPNPTGEQHGV